MTDGFKPSSGEGGDWREWRHHVLSELATIRADMKCVKVAVHGGEGQTGLSTLVDRNTRAREKMEESWLRYRVVIVGAFVSGIAGILFNIVLVTVGGR